MEQARQRRAEVIRLNQELARNRERLEHVNMTLVRAWRAAEQAELRQQQLSIFISHELRTPINLVIGFTDMLMGSLGDNGLNTLPLMARRDLDGILRGVQQISDLVDDVLDMASLDVGKLPIIPKPTNLSQLVTEAVEMVRDYVHAQGLELRLVCMDDLPVLFIDPLRIRQVLLNLLVNAARFTDRGSLSIAVAREGKAVRVEVTDTGRGIPDDELDNIFREFHSRPAKDSMWAKGTGLGLPLSRQLIQHHGGEMGMKSKLGMGSTFWFSLPISEDLPKMDELVRTPGDQTATGRPGFEPTVILFDEEEALMHRVGRWLDRYHLVSSGSWEEATAKARSYRATAILVDYDTEIGEAIDSPPILRAYLPTFRRRAQQLGVAAYLEKPIDGAQLAITLECTWSDASSVLIVDDDRLFTEMIRRMLGVRIPQWRIEVAHDGVDALRRLRSDRPDGMLLDLALPEMDGWQVLAEMKGDPYIAGIPVVVVSGQQGGARLGDKLEVRRTDGLALSQTVALLRASLDALSDNPIAVPSSEDTRSSDPA